MYKGPISKMTLDPNRAAGKSEYKLKGPFFGNQKNYG
jgi:YHS domain-containing protein